MATTAHFPDTWGFSTVSYFQLLKSDQPFSVNHKMKSSLICMLLSMLWASGLAGSPGFIHQRAACNADDCLRIVRNHVRWTSCLLRGLEKLTAPGSRHQCAARIKSGRDRLQFILSSHRHDIHFVCPYSPDTLLCSLTIEESLEVTVTETVTTSGAAKRDASGKSQATTAILGLPSYISAACGADVSRYSSACSVRILFGILRGLIQGQCQP